MLAWVILYHGFYKGFSWYQGNPSNINMLSPLGRFSWWLSIPVWGLAGSDGSTMGIHWHWFLHPNAHTDVLTAVAIRDILLPLFGEAERQWTEIYQTKPPIQRPYSFHFSATLLSFLVSFRKKNLLCLFLSMKFCWSPFRKEVLTYFSSYDDNQCNYAEGCLSANSRACCSLLHLLSFTCSQLLLFKMAIYSLRGKDPQRKLCVVGDWGVVVPLSSQWGCL